MEHQEKNFDGLRFTESTRRLAVGQARMWTATQAHRLGVTEEELLDAIRRGWLPEQIERIISRYSLEAQPPMLNGVTEKYRLPEKMKR